MEHAVVKRWLRAAAASAAAVAAAGCSGGNDDLRAYMDEIKARPGGRIEPLPEIRPAPTFVYEAAGRRSPFIPDNQQDAGPNPDGVPGPDRDRPREHLEQFPLDTLRMVGTLEGDGGYYGLVRTNDGLIHRVRVGNYLGQNHGRIQSITESEIELVEIVSDGVGGYIERPASISLSD